MKKLKTLFISLLMLSMIGGLSGCSLFGGGEDPEALRIVKAGFVNLYGLTSLGYELNVTGDLAVEGQNAAYKLVMSGGLDMYDAEAPLFTLDFDGRGADDSEYEFGIQMEARLDKENFYFIVSDSNDSADPEEPILPGSLNSLLGEWWRIALPEGSFEGSSFPIGDKEALTESDKEFRELLEDTIFFKNFKSDGIKEGSYVYTADLDKDAVSDFLVELAERRSQLVTETAIDNLDESLEAVEMPFEIWVDEDSMILSKIIGTLVVEQVGSTTTLDFELILGDFNEPVVVEAPAESSEFDTMMLFGAAMGVDMSDVDMDMYMDLGEDLSYDDLMEDNLEFLEELQ